jgi:hypothetical protein
MSTAMTEADVDDERHPILRAWRLLVLVGVVLVVVVVGLVVSAHGRSEHDRQLDRASRCAIARVAHDVEPGDCP